MFSAYIEHVLCNIAGSSAAGRWTAWPWRGRKTMAFPCHWTQSSSRPLGSWAGGPVSAPSLTTLLGNMEPTSCFLQHSEVNAVIYGLLYSWLLLTYRWWARESVSRWTVQSSFIMGTQNPNLGECETKLTYCDRVCLFAAAPLSIYSWKEQL